MWKSVSDPPLPASTAFKAWGTVGFPCWHRTQLTFVCAASYLQGYFVVPVLGFPSSWNMVCLRTDFYFLHHLSVSLNISISYSSLSWSLFCLFCFHNIVFLLVSWCLNSCKLEKSVISSRNFFFRNLCVWPYIVYLLTWMIFFLT